MTLAPNHRQPLNGSKLLSFLLVIFLFVSCDPSKRATKTSYPRHPIPESGQTKPTKPEVVKNQPTTKKDTIPKTPTNPLPTNHQIPDQGAVKVALLLPFLTNNFSETDDHIQPKSEIAIQFYAGMKLALYEASYEQLPIDITVLDSKASYSETVNLQSNPAVAEADIIIGPYRKKNANLIAQTAVRKGQIMISPFSDIQPQLLSGNGAVIETFASLDTYMQAIVKYLIQSGNINNAVIVKRKNGADDRATNSLQNAFKAANGGQVIAPLKELEVDQADLSFEKLELKETLEITPNTVFIIPVWKSPNYVSSIVRKIFVSRSPEASPTIIGMPQWISGKNNLDYQKLNDLHTIIPAAEVIHRSTPSKSIENRFYQAYGTLPDKNAYKGYDLGKYLIQLIRANRQSALTVPNSTGLLVDYRFTEGYNNPTDELKNQPVIFKNNFVKMLRLEDYQLTE